MSTTADVSNVTAPLPSAGQLVGTAAPTTTAGSTTTLTTPVAGGTNATSIGSGLAADPTAGSTTTLTAPVAGATNATSAGSGLAADQNGVNATITPSSLSSGQGGSGGSSGMSFLASPQQSGSGASVSGSLGGDTGRDPTTSSYGGWNHRGDGAASRGDFTPPRSSGSSSWHQYGGSDTGHGGGWSTGYNDHPVTPLHHL